MSDEVSNEETRFTEAFYAVLNRDVNRAPSPTRINCELGKDTNPLNKTPLKVLNGRMSALRRHLLIKNGFVKNYDTGRWMKP